MANDFLETDPDKLAPPPPPAYGDPYESDTSPPPSLKRRSSESSTERSMYDEKFAAATAPAAAATAVPASSIPASAPAAGERMLHIYAEGDLHRNSSICSKNAAGQSVTEYYAESSRFQPNKPDILIHSGADANGPVRAAAKFRWTRTLHLCLGDPQGPGEHRWEEMTNKSLLLHSKYDLRISRPEGVQHLVWERTHGGSDAVEAAGGSKASFHNYRILDQGTGQVVAMYLSNNLKSWKKRGKLILYAPHEPELEQWIVLGTVGLIEKARRRQNRRAATGSGGGGA